MLKLLFRLMNVYYGSTFLIRTYHNITDHILCSQEGDHKIFWMKIFQTLSLLKDATNKVPKY
jgi:hypothetical protein